MFGTPSATSAGGRARAIAMRTPSETAAVRRLAAFTKPTYVRTIGEPPRNCASAPLRLHRCEYPVTPRQPVIRSRVARTRRPVRPVIVIDR